MRRRQFLTVTVLTGGLALAAGAQTTRTIPRRVGVRKAVLRSPVARSVNRPAPIDPGSAAPPHVQARRKIEAAVRRAIGTAGRHRLGKGVRVHDVGPGKKYSTIQAAVNAAREDDWIRIAPGTYREAVLTNRMGRHPHTHFKRLHFLGTTPKQVVLQTPTRHQGTALTLGLGSTIRNMTIRSAAVGVEFAEGAGSLKSVRFIDNKKGIQAYSLAPSPAGTRRRGWRPSVLELKGCEFDRTEVGLGSGRVFEPIKTDIRGCRFRRYKAGLSMSRGFHQIVGNVFEDGEMNAISAQGQGEGLQKRPRILIQGNSFQKAGNAVQVTAAKVVGVNDNVIEGGKNGIQIHSQDQYSTGVAEVLRNRVIEPRTRCILIDADRSVVESNLVVGGTYGISLGGKDLNLYNNTVYGTKGIAAWLRCVNGSRTVVARNNIFAEVQRDLVLNCSGAQLASVTQVWGRNLRWKVRDLSPTPGKKSGDLSVDPWFGNAAKGIYRLLPGSQAIDRGLNVPLKSKRDVSGLPRKRGKAYDLGAFESR